MRRRGASRLLVAALFVVVAGMLSMHGVGSHGVASAGHLTTGHTGHVTSADHVSAAAAIGGHRIASAMAGAEVGPTAAQLFDRAADGEAGSVGALCVAVLSVLAVLLVLASALRRRQVVPPPSLLRWRVRIIRRRERDPPSLAQLSVLRR